MSDEPARHPTPVTPDPWTALRRHTPARIALGRSGDSLPTAELLRFGVAHALARDAVHVPLDAAALRAELQADGWPVIEVHSAAADRATYLLRPDLGRRLDEPSTLALRHHASTSASATSTAPAGCDLLPVVADGLSSAAARRHALPLLARLRELAPPKLVIGPVVLALQARVALGDAIGECLRARSVLMLIGERPGLSSPDSLGLYLTWAPRPGRSDAERNCISNVRPEGLPYDDAARTLLWLWHEAARLQLTGVGLKDRSGEALVNE